MPETVERRLEAAADATDDVVRQWQATPNALPLTATQPRRRRLVLYPALSAAAIVALGVGAFALVRTTSGPGDGHSRTASLAGGGPSATRTRTSWVVPPPPPSTSAQAPQQAAQALAALVPGLRDLSAVSRATGSYEVTARYGQHGKQLAVLTLDVRPGSTQEAKNPCVLGAGDRPGRQGAPAPTDTCTALRQSDGSAVWVWRKNYSPLRYWTTQATKEWEISQLRPDGTFVDLDVTNLINSANPDHPTYARPTWQIAQRPLVAVVTSSHVRPGGVCTEDCQQQPRPPR